jgi:hypothetical protein
MQTASPSDLETTVPIWRPAETAVTSEKSVPLSSHTWIARYCQEARRLRPELLPSVAIRRAVAAFPYAADMAPESAADLYASLSEVRARRRRRQT